jgi:hypothetical protein
MFHIGDEVLYDGTRYWIINGPTMSTQGPIYDLSVVPPPIVGVRQDELRPVPRT